MNWVVAPLLLPLITGVIGPMFGRSSRPRRWLFALSAATQVGVHAWLLHRACLESTLALHVGGWPATVGVTLAVDPLSGVMLVLTSTAALACLLFGYAATPLEDEHPLRLPLMQFLMAGVNLALITADLFNFFVALELLLISSYALLTLEADDRAIRFTFPYVAINIVGSAALLGAAALAYAIFGTLNFAGIAARAGELAGDARITALAALLLVALGSKSAVVPLFFWLPASYPVLAHPIGALFAATLTKVGAYGLLRMFGGVLPAHLDGPQAVLRALAAITLIVGALGALSRRDLRSVFSFLLISHLGFVVLALGLSTHTSIAAGVFYLAHEIPTIAALFLIAGVVARLNGSDHLERIGGLARTAPWLGAACLCQALSLAGFPPFSGFWGKLAIVSEAFTADHAWLVACALTTSVLTLIVMLRVWIDGFWRERDVAAETRSGVVQRKWMTGVAVALTALSLAMGLGAEGVWRVAAHAADVLLDRQAYAQQVLDSF